MVRRMILVLTLLLALIAVPAHGNDTAIFYVSFDDPAEAEMWDGVIFDGDDVSKGAGAVYVYNPWGDESYGRISHLFTYKGAAAMESGAIYRLSMEIKSLDPNADQIRGAGLRFDGDGLITFEFSGIPDKWTKVSQFFMVPASAEYHFSVEIKNGSVDTGFMVDEITIERIDIIPESLAIMGDSSLTIPYSGEITSQYRVGAYSNGGDSINILSSISTITAKDLPAGVTFDSSTGVVTVNEYCPDNSHFILECDPPDFLSLEPISMEVTLSRNLLKNSDFSEGDKYWLTNPAADVNFGSTADYLTMYTASTPYGCYATLRPEYSVLLTEGAMYVLRARVRVDGETGESLYSRNTAVSRDGEVVINILNLPTGGWIEVIAAFTPEATGLYGVSVNFVTPYESILDIESITLSPEQPEETYITLHAPGNISIPNAATTFPFNVYIRDQAGEIMSSDCSVSIYPDVPGVSLTRNGLLVTPDATVGEYELRAEAEDNSSMTATLNFTLSFSNVGDGGFEEKRVNEWWAAGAPAVMTIEDGGDGKYARITSDESYAIVLNNSYMRLFANIPYAFRADIVGGSGQTVTAFLETSAGDRIPIIQSGGENSEILELFQIDEDAVARLLLYVSSESGGVDVGIDNIELFTASVWVTVPTISGTAYPGSEVDAQFNFHNNLDPYSDPSSCVVSWFVQDTDGSEPEYLGGGSSFTIPNGTLDKYLYCEVTPICSVTGLSGATVKSVPVLVGGDSGGNDNDYTDPPVIDSRPAIPVLEPLKLEKVSVELPFTDAADDWANEEISMLYQIGVVNGVSSTAFDPSAPIKRGELAAMICRAFNASGGNHSYYDVPADSWYSNYIATVNVLGLMDGVSDISFAPEEPVSRELITVIMMRIYEYFDLEAPLSSLHWFYDAREISDWALDSVAKGVSIGLVTGNASSTFAPKRSATRSEACAMLVRLMEIIERDRDYSRK